MSRGLGDGYKRQVNALDDLAGRKTITDMDRGSLHAGMMASHRIIEITPPDVVDYAASVYDQHSRAWGKAKA
jgi:hypothetical protein